MKTAYRAGVALCALLAALPAGSALAQEIGTAGAVNPAATGTPPARPTRVLELGARVIHKERIRTVDGGNVQLIFIDKTTLSIGPNSDIVIDEFVYDPNTGTGRMAASMAKGVLRFVGGNTSHTGGATIKTPAATLGIRGGVATVTHGAEGTKAINHFGILSVATAAGTEIIRRPGFAVTVASPAAVPPAPKRVAQAEVEQANGELSSRSGQSGGARQRPTDDTASRAGVGQVNAQVGPGLVEGQRQTITSARATSTTTAAVATTQVQTLTQNLTQQATNQAVTQRIAEEVAARQPERVRPKEKAFALVTTTDPGLNSRVPYVLGSAVANGNVSITPIYAYRTENPDAESLKPQPARTLQVGFGIEGRGAQQTSNFLVATGAFTTNERDELSYSGGFRFTSRRAANITMGSARGSIAGAPGGITADPDRTPTRVAVNQDFVDAAGKVTADQAFARPGGGGAGQNYGFNQTFTRTDTPSGLGQNRPERTLTGWAGGMVRTLDVARDVNIEPAQPLFGSASVQLDPGDSRVQAYIYSAAMRTGTGDSAAPTGAYEYGLAQFGNLNRDEHARGTYIDYDRFGAREAATDISRETQTPLSIVNDVALTRDSGLMASSGTTSVKASFPEVNFCQCEYTRWGFWSQETRRTQDGREYADRIHLGTWIAGEVSEAEKIPTAGTATYSGHAIGSFRSGGNEYVAAGNFRTTVDFARQTGNVAVTGLDNRDYAGTMSISPGSAYFFSTDMRTTGTSPTSAATMQLFGNFYKGPGGPIQEMGGQMLVNGLGGYTGSGIFAGRQN
ncbi:MAG TPA: FecR domain-containing protein [Beijerinckiaceae bacterium]|jgi:hypothetical protein